jgi:hypothetical protein
VNEGSTTLLVTITLAVAAVAVLAAIVVVAVGGGGELSVEHPDHPPLALPGRRPVAGTDAALLRLPLGLWGYHKQITDEALHRFAQELTERDTRIAVLEQELAEARQQANGGALEPARRRALPAGRGEAGGDPFATRLDQGMARLDRGTARLDRGTARPDQGTAQADQGTAQADQGTARLDQGAAPLGLPAGRDDPGATRTDDSSADEPQDGFAPPDPTAPADSWKTIADGDDDKDEKKKDDDA